MEGSKVKSSQILLLREIQGVSVQVFVKWDERLHTHQDLFITWNRNQSQTTFRKEEKLIQIKGSPGAQG